MLYEIIIDCRINNKDYKKWDIVSNAEVEYFPSVMRPVSWATKPDPKVEEKKLEKVEEDHIENDLEKGDEEVKEEKVEEKKEVKSNKKRSKKK